MIIHRIYVNKELDGRALHYILFKPTVTAFGNKILRLTLCGSVK